MALRRQNCFVADEVGASATQDFLAALDLQDGQFPQETPQASQDAEVPLEMSQGPIQEPAAGACGDMRVAVNTACYLGAHSNFTCAA